MIWLFLLCVVVVLVDLNALRTPFVMDDLRDTIVENANIRQLGSLAGWRAVLLTPGPETPVTGRPLASLSFALNYAAGGVDPFGYHLANLVIHLLCAALVFGIVRATAERVLADRPDALSIPALPFAFAGAALWAVHPLHTEVIDYVTQRTESMMAFFYLLTLYCAIRAQDIDARPEGRAYVRTAQGRAYVRRWTGAAIAASALGMLCKESMVTAPVMVLLHDVAFGARSAREAWRRRPRLYGGLAASWLVLLATMLTHPVIRSRGLGADVTPWSYFLNQPQLIVRYLRLAVWPDTLILDYGVPRAVALREAAPSALLLVALVGGVVWLWRRAPTLGFLGTWFFATLAPTSSFAPIATEVGAERRMYLPLIAFTVLTVIAIARIVHVVARVSPQAVPFTLGVTLASAGVALATRTVHRNAEYADPLRLWQTTEANYPHARVRYTVGVELAKQGRAAESIAKFQEASPEYPRADFALGLAFASLSRHDEALHALNAFITRRPDDVEVPAAYVAIGKSAAALGHGDRAEAAYRTALRLVPGSLDAQLALADLLRRAERYDEAAAAYRAYLGGAPTDANARSNLGIALVAKGDAIEALAEFTAAAALAPGDAAKHENLAHALAGVGRLDAAIESYRTALALAPGRPELRSALGNALVMRGKTDEGLTEIRRALAAAPGNPAVRSDAQTTSEWLAAHPAAP